MMMVDVTKIQKGMQVYGEDNQPFGKIERISGQDVFISGKSFLMNSFSRLEQNRLYMAGSDQELNTAFQQDSGTIKVPVVQEQLNVGKRQVELGEVELQKTVTQEQVNVPVELRREEVHVQEVDVPDRPIAAEEVATAFQEGTIRVPVRGEKAVVNKEAVLTGEVVVNKGVTAEQQTISDTVRKEQVNVDNNVTRTAKTPAVSSRVEAVVQTVTPVTAGTDQVNVAATGTEAYLSGSSSKKASANANASSYGQSQVEEDMEVYSSDDHHLGKVKVVTEAYFLVGRGLFKGSIEAGYNSIQQLDSDRIILNLTKDQVDALT